MIGFRFESNVLTLDIEGEAFTIEMSNDYLKSMRRYARECGIYADIVEERRARQEKELRENRRNPEVIEALERKMEEEDAKAEAFISGMIERILGKGAVEKIFFFREKNLFNLCDLLIYICDECIRFQTERLKKYKSLAEAGRTA